MNADPAVPSVPLDDEPLGAALPLDEALVTIHEIGLTDDLDPEPAVERFLRDHRLTAEATRAAVAVGLTVLAARHEDALEAFLAFESEVPEGVAWPLKLGVPTEASGLADARHVLDAAGRVVGVCSSDAGPALVGPLDRVEVGRLLEAGRFLWRPSA